LLNHQSEKVFPFFFLTIETCFQNFNSGNPLCGFSPRLSILVEASVFFLFKLLSFFGCSLGLPLCSFCLHSSSSIPNFRFHFFQKVPTFQSWLMLLVQDFNFSVFKTFVIAISVDIFASPEVPDLCSSLFVSLLFPPFGFYKIKTFLPEFISFTLLIFNDMPFGSQINQRSALLFFLM